MKKRIFAFLAAVACLGLLAGCSSPEKTIEKIKNIYENDRSEAQWIQLAEAYEKTEDVNGAKHTLMDAVLYFPNSEKLQEMLNKYLLPAPAPDKAPGSYEGRVRLNFSGNAFESGTLYVTVDRDEPYGELTEDKSVKDDGLTVKEYPSEWDFTVDLYTPGQHTVRAFVVGLDNYIQSKVFEGIYTLNGASFNSFGFSQPSGEYKAPLRLSFNGTDGGTVSYTLDGTDPLWMSASGPNLTGGGSDSVFELTEDTLPLSAGNITITARCITDNGLVSPLITATYNVIASFDAASSQTDEDGTYDYICNNWSGVVRFDRRTNRYDTIFNQKATHIAAYVITAAPEITETTIGEAALQKITKTYVYARTNLGSVFRSAFTNGEGDGWQQIPSAESLNRVGEGWHVYSYRSDRDNKLVQNILWNLNTAKQGTEEVAKTANLMLDGTAYYRKGYSVMACDLDGKNERELWSEEASGYLPTLDAVTDAVLLYHRDSENGVLHLVYNLKTGERYVNPYLSTGDDLLGYTSTAAYTDVAGTIYHTSIDYSTLETGTPIQEEPETPAKEDPVDETEPDTDTGTNTGTNTDTSTGISYDIYVNAKDNLGLNMREGPGTTYATVRENPVPMYTKLHITQEAKDSAGRLWGYTSYTENGRTDTGWVCLVETSTTDPRG